MSCEVISMTMRFHSTAPAVLSASSNYKVMTRSAPMTSPAGHVPIDFSWTQWRPMSSGLPLTAVSLSPWLPVWESAMTSSFHPRWSVTLKLSLTLHSNCVVMFCCSATTAVFVIEMAKASMATVDPQLDSINAVQSVAFVFTIGHCVYVSSQLL